MDAACSTVSTAPATPVSSPVAAALPRPRSPSESGAGVNFLYCSRIARGVGGRGGGGAVSHPWISASAGGSNLSVRRIIPGSRTESSSRMRTCGGSWGVGRREGAGGKRGRRGQQFAGCWGIFLPSGAPGAQRAPFP